MVLTRPKPYIIKEEDGEKGGGTMKKSIDLWMRKQGQEEGDWKKGVCLSEKVAKEAPRRTVIQIVKMMGTVKD